jgi:hypothetical protein
LGSKGKKKERPALKEPGRRAGVPKVKGTRKPPAQAKMSSVIPEVVSKRMAKRMAIFCGVPTLLGLATFPVSYFGFFQNGIELPNVAILLTSLGGLGLGVLGLSYGVMSASWDEGEPGSKLGWQEFKLNCSRMVENWKASRDRKS